MKFRRIALALGAMAGCGAPLLSVALPDESALTIYSSQQPGKGR